MPSAVFDNIYVRSGDTAPETGFYLYKGPAKRGGLPLVLEGDDKVLLLEKGQRVPRARSYKEQDAVFRLTIRHGER